MAPEQLRAELDVEPRRGRWEELLARGALTNVGHDPLTIELGPLSSPSLALELAGPRGPIGMPPPPVPGAPQRVTLGPGQSHAVEYAAFPPPGEAGPLRVRLRYVVGPQPGAEAWSGDVTSPWVEFEVR